MPALCAMSLILLMRLAGGILRHFYFRAYNFYRYYGTSPMIDYLILPLLGIILFVLIYLFHKMRNMHKMVYRTQVQIEKNFNDTYHQIEFLHGLYVDLKLDNSLPATREWAASPDFLWHIVQHALNRKPKTVVECSSGVSTLVLARSMQLNGYGHVYSLEDKKEFAEKTKDHLKRMGLDEWATVLHSPIKSYQLNDKEWFWYSTESLNKMVKDMDMLVIDGPSGRLMPLARYPAGPLLFERLNERSVVFLDDASRLDEKSILNLWSTEFPDLKQESISTEKGCALIYF